jgi:hypothetical protein
MHYNSDSNNIRERIVAASLGISFLVQVHGLKLFFFFFFFEMSKQGNGEEDSNL